MTEHPTVSVAAPRATPSSSVVRGIRRAAIIAIIASLSIAALLGIIALLSGEFGELQGRVLLTTLTIAAFGTTALCHLAVVTRAVRVVGFVGIAASVLAALCALVLIWAEFDGWRHQEGWLKSLAIFALLATSLAQANLLLLLARRPQALIRGALVATLVAVGIVAFMVALPILSGGDIPTREASDGYWRVFGVVAILDALGTIALPVLGLVLRGAAPEGEQLPAPDATDAAPHVVASSTPLAAASATTLVVPLPPELASRLDSYAAAAGVSREQRVLDVLDMVMPPAAP